MKYIAPNKGHAEVLTLALDESMRPMRDEIIRLGAEGAAPDRLLTEYDYHLVTITWHPSMEVEDITEEFLSLREKAAQSLLLVGLVDQGIIGKSEGVICPTS